MNMNRRQFGISFAGAGALVAAGPVMLTLEGCPLTPGQIENMVTTILQEATGIIAVADSSVSWLADFTKATNLLNVDEANWIKGGAVQDVINVLVDLQGVCALISGLVPYAQLVAVLVAGIVQVLSLLLPPPPVPVAMAKMASKPNPWIGVAHVSSVKDSKEQWTKFIKANPALAAASLK
jgi:hypothetical protein